MMNISKAVSNISQENFIKWFKQSCAYIFLPTMQMKVYKVFQTGKFVYNFLVTYSYCGDAAEFVSSLKNNHLINDETKFISQVIEWRGFNLLDYTHEAFIYQEENQIPGKIQGMIRSAYNPIAGKQVSREMEPCTLVLYDDFNYETIDFKRLKEII